MTIHYTNYMKCNINCVLPHVPKLFNGNISNLKFSVDEPKKISCSH